MQRILCGLIFAILANSAMADLEIKDVKAYPNPARFKGTQPPQLVFDIDVGLHGTFPDSNGCILTIDFGDGSRAPRFNFPPFGNRRATYRHVYQKPGTYTFIAFGVGNNGCRGERRVSVIVEDTEAAVPKTAEELAAMCPTGWSLVKGSQQGNRFSCRVNPPAQPIACAEGTKYFESQQGMVGCR